MMKRENIIILYIETIEIQLLDIPRALDELGFNVYKASLGIRAQGFDKEACERITSAIEHFKVQCAISYDFSESIAQACFETGIPYISWVYDAPQQELYTHYAKYPGNYIFVFDKMQQKRLRHIGLENVYHMPLAVHADKVQKALKKATETQEEYLHDISFVGQLYYKEKVEKAYQMAPEDVRESLEHNISSCFLKWDSQTKMHGSMQENVISYLSGLDKHGILEKYPYITEQFNYEAAVLSRMLANRERVFILNTLSEKYKVDFYTFDEYVEQLSERVNIHPGAKYDYEVSEIYKRSKINLNITLHCIETGASQRIFDVMAAGGFMLSNYQEELEELFVPGKEIVLYHNMEELEHYIAYYLEHEDERRMIAKKGQEKVLRLHGFHNKLLRVMELVYGKEQSRKESYIVLQRKELIRLANEELAKFSKEAYDHLYTVFSERIYETTIQRTTQLGILREMLECHHVEEAIAASSIFSDVKNLDEIEYKYHEVKHNLWRMEQELCEEKYMGFLQKLLLGEISLFFAAWQIYANMCDREKLYIMISNYLRKENIVKAVEFLTYALWWLKGNCELLIYKADCLMELGMWKDALETLKQIDNPDEDIKSLIDELKKALNETGGEYE